MIAYIYTDRNRSQVGISISHRQGVLCVYCTANWCPPSTHACTHTVGDAVTSGIREGDKLLEVNGCSVRGLGHQEAGKMISEGPGVATLLIHTVKPAPTPNGGSSWSDSQIFLPYMAAAHYLLPCMAATQYILPSLLVDC